METVITMIYKTLDIIRKQFLIIIIIIIKLLAKLIIITILFRMEFSNRNSIPIIHRMLESKEIMKGIPSKTIRQIILLHVKMIR